jgi:hypothetical protein
VRKKEDPVMPNRSFSQGVVLGDRRFHNDDSKIRWNDGIPTTNQISFPSSEPLVNEIVSRNLFPVSRF